MEERFAERRRKEAFAKELIFKCIETETVDPDDLLLNILPWISQQHYGDIEEERSIGGVCGYPCCGNEVDINGTSKKDTQQFTIFSQSKR